MVRDPQTRATFAPAIAIARDGRVASNHTAEQPSGIWLEVKDRTPPTVDMTPR